MTFKQFWRVLIKQWKLIVICFLLVGAWASIGSKLSTPLYQSSALVQVTIDSGNNQSAYTNLLASIQLVQTEAVLATSDPVLREVSSHYKGLTVEQLTKEVTATPKSNTQLFSIVVLDPSPIRAAALANDIAATLEKQQLQTQVSQQGSGQNNLLVVQTAQPNFRPVQPDIPFNTGAGLLSGLLLGILLALLFDLLDMRVRTLDALTQLLNWPIIATVWLASSSKTEKEDAFNPARHSTNVEAYRSLRSSIGFLTIDKTLHFLMVTSALSGEGKSTTAANLAIFMAKAGRKTLLVDADLRHPVLHKLFNISVEKMGLSSAILACNMLTSERDTSTHLQLDSFVHSVGIANLGVMPAGPIPPNPSELLDSNAMKRLLTAIADHKAEIVIFDTPPVIGISDASILAARCDGVLVVVDILHAHKKSLKQMKSLLTQARAQVLGCVVNKQKRKHHDTLYSYDPIATEQNSKENHNSKHVKIPLS